MQSLAPSFQPRKQVQGRVQRLHLRARLQDPQEQESQVASRLRKGVEIEGAGGTQRQAESAGAGGGTGGI